jgi:hypothetical protein
MDGIDLAREVKMRWPLLSVILTSGHPRERVGELPPGVAYMPSRGSRLHLDKLPEDRMLTPGLMLRRV